MKKYPTILTTCLIPVLLFASKHIETCSDEPLVLNRDINHIGIVVKDIDVALDKWMEMFGIKERPPIIIAEGDSKNPTQYRGETSDAMAKLAFLSLENIRIELIQPIGEARSHWREFLETKGEGVHHLGIDVPSIGNKEIELFKSHGYCLAQHGGWKTGEYGYMDTHDAIGVTIELLEHYKQ